MAVKKLDMDPDWLEKIAAEIFTPEYRAESLKAARENQRREILSSRERRLNPDPIDHSANAIGRRLSTYEFISRRGD